MMTWKNLVCILNRQCSGICGEASYRGKRLILVERGRNRCLKTNINQNFTWADNHLIIFNIVQQTCILSDLAKFCL